VKVYIGVFLTKSERRFFFFLHASQLIAKRKTRINSVGARCLRHINVRVEDRLWSPKFRGEENKSGL
jgi:hypothetical protein